MQQYLSTKGLHVGGLPLQPLLHSLDFGSRLPRGCLQCDGTQRITTQTLLAGGYRHHRQQVGLTPRTSRDPPHAHHWAAWKPVQA